MPWRLRGRSIATNLALAAALLIAAAAIVLSFANLLPLSGGLFRSPPASLAPGEGQSPYGAEGGSQPAEGTEVDTVHSDLRSRS
jgi:hypothetical protein